MAKLIKEEKQASIAIITIFVIATVVLYWMTENGFSTWIPEVKSIIIVLYISVLFLFIFGVTLIIKTKLLPENHFIEG